MKKYLSSNLCNSSVRIIAFISQLCTHNLRAPWCKRKYAAALRRSKFFDWAYPEVYISISSLEDDREKAISLMHEQSIVASLLTLALENAGKAKARKIFSIDLVVGDYTGVLEDAVSFYFGFLSKDTIAAGARINYTHVPGQLRCRDCDLLFPLQKHEYHCPKCEGKRVEIVGGRELYIENMEVE